MIGIRKARLASFVLLLACFAAMLVVHVVMGGSDYIYVAFAIVIGVAVVCWWIVYRSIFFEEVAFFEALADDVNTFLHRLRTFESAVRQIGDGVVIVAEEVDLVFVNETAKRLFAAFDSDLDGFRYDEHAAGFSEKLERATILAAAEDGRPPETVSVDGQFYKIGYVALVPEKGRGKGAVAVISDVTESTKADNMQSSFISNVSHELKTPLASVRSYAETLLTGAVDEEKMINEFLEMILLQADRMNSLVIGLMDLEKMDYSKQVGDSSESDLPSLVKTSIKKIEMVAKEKSLTVNRLFSDELKVNVEMNRDRIEQVLINVLGNAIKYTEEKGRVDIDIISGQNCVQIVITDNGTGIPEEDLPHVFERLYRADKARTSKTEGSGLGLAISKQIVDAHGGTIGIESKYGRGTTATVSLPTNKGRGVPGIL